MMICGSCGMRMDGAAVLACKVRMYDVANAGRVPVISAMGNLPIGQGLSVTPMQMAAAYSAIANGGILRAPRLVLENGDSPVTPPPGHRVISKQTSAQLRRMLEGAGAGRHRVGGQRSGLHPGGKTGTAQVAVNGAIPHPVRCLVRRLRRGAGSPTAGCGGRRRASGQLLRRGGRRPAFGDIAKFALPYLEIPPDQRGGGFGGCRQHDLPGAVAPGRPGHSA
jgi:hypothetical protein